MRGHLIAAQAQEGQFLGLEFLEVRKLLIPLPEASLAVRGTMLV